MVPSVKKLKKNKIFVDGNRKGLLFMLALALIFICIGLFGLKYSQNINDYTRNFCMVYFAFFFYAGVICIFFIINSNNVKSIALLIVAWIILRIYFGEIVTFNLLVISIIAFILFISFFQFIITFFIELIFLTISFLLAYYTTLYFGFDLFICYCVYMFLGTLAIYFQGNYIYNFVVNKMQNKKSEKTTFMHKIKLMFIERKSSGFNNYVYTSYFFILFIAYITGFMIQENVYTVLLNVFLFIIIGVFQVEWERIIMDVMNNNKNVLSIILKAFSAFKMIHRN